MSTDPRLSQNIHVCDDDSSSERGWRSARHRHRDIFSQVCRQNVGSSSGRWSSPSVHHFNLPGQAILSKDGIGAYDHALRSVMMYKLLSVPGLRGLMLFVRTTYAHPTSYRWQDAVGVTHQIHEAEGGEQGDPLVPLLFSLAIHDALVAVQAELREGQVLFAFLDDVYVVTGPNRTREVFDLLAEHLWRFAGISLHTGKTRVWNISGVSSQNVEDLGEQVWNREGIKVLGTPVGTDQFVSDAVTERVQEESRL